MDKPSQKPTDQLREKWGNTNIEAGWSGAPNVLINHAAELGLSSLDLHILLVINTHWWKAENKPFVSIGLIAEACGVEPRSVQRRIKAMERAPLIRRVAQKSRTYRNSNIFLFDSLIAALQSIAVRVIEERKRDRQIRALRGQPKRPSRYKLKVVSQ